MPANALPGSQWATFGNWSVAPGTVRDRAVTQPPTGLQTAGISAATQAENRGELIKLAVVIALIWGGFALYDMKGR